MLFTFFKALLFSSVPHQPGLKSEKLDGLSLRKGRCKEDLQDVFLSGAERKERPLGKKRR